MRRSTISASRRGVCRLASLSDSFFNLPISITLFERSFKRRRISSSSRSISFLKWGMSLSWVKPAPLCVAERPTVPGVCTEFRRDRKSYRITMRNCKDINRICLFMGGSRSEPRINWQSKNPASSAVRTRDLSFFRNARRRNAWPDARGQCAPDSRTESSKVRRRLPACSVPHSRPPPSFQFPQDRRRTFQ